ncbi:MAG: peptidoglycan bridge formation glycyltransferase FemA/FemB family protein [Patescibacteria group bacterium]
MALQKLKSASELTKLILDNPDFYQNQGVFLQGGEWQKVWRQEAKDFVSYAYYKDGRCLGLLSASLHRTKLGISYLYSPKGPLFCGHQAEAKEFLEEIIQETRRLGVHFWRFEPSSDLFNNWFNQSKKIIFNKIKDIQPSQTIQLDLAKSETELLSAMHPKTRYNIRLAEKKDLEFSQGGAEDFEDFWSLMSTTSERDAFRLHSRDHYQVLLDQSDFIRLFLVRYQGRAVAAGLFSFFADTVTYLHGASANADRNLMAPYLLQWELIRQAKAEGYKHYDFYGIDAQRWPGVTRFKSGFGGKVLSCPGSYDLVLRPLAYRLYSFLKSLKS